MSEVQPLLVQNWSHLVDITSVELFIKRDDLLPFPLAGNKVRKLTAEMNALGVVQGDVVITNGGVVSNYARTLAFMAASRGAQAHLVLHASRPNLPDGLSSRIYSALGARLDIVAAGDIAPAIEAARIAYASRGARVHVLSGGGHSAAGADASRVEASRTIRSLPPLDAIFVASGTGATQAGIAVAAAQDSPRTRVVGISVAREELFGKAAVAEAVSWLREPKGVPVEFIDEFRDGGYGITSRATADVVNLAWRRGLPLDGTYTGKAFRGMRTMLPELGRNARVLFWHTGGLANYLDEPRDELL